ncbi:hypothetical protein JCM10213_002352 [Rhodosporidiobolus nylandii]
MEASCSSLSGGVYVVSSDFCKKVKTTSLLSHGKPVRSLAVPFGKVGSTRVLHQLPPPSPSPLRPSV